MAFVFEQRFLVRYSKINDFYFSLIKAADVTKSDSNQQAKETENGKGEASACICFKKKSLQGTVLRKLLYVKNHYKDYSDFPKKTSDTSTESNIDAFNFKSFEVGLILNIEPSLT